MLKMPWRLCFAWLAGLVLSGSAHALEPFAETPQETALCSALIYGGKIRNEGEGHYSGHYCDCVRFRYRANRKVSDKTAFRYNLEQAVSGCNYVLSHHSESPELLPKIHVDKGRALRLLGNIGPAEQEFRKAIELNPSETNAYAELAELQRVAGQRPQALETVTLGLRHSPDAKFLRKRYLELGGKEPLPEPIAKVVAIPDPPMAGAEDDAASSAARSESRSDEAASIPDRGCRFCPPDEVQHRWRDSFNATQKAQ